MNNMRTLLSGLTVSFFVVACMALPRSGQAFSVELVSILPEPSVDISDQLGAGPSEDAEVEMFGWLTEEDTEYVAVFNVDEEPAMLVTPGGDVSLTTPPEYDSDAGTYTVTFTASGLIGSQPAPGTVSLIAMVGAVEVGEDGPPAEMRGGWLSTNLQDWELIPPSPDNVAFGYNLTGPVGETGFLHMFIPNTLIDLLSSLSGVDLDPQDMAVFNGNDQSSISITELDDGIYVDINVEFSEDTSTVSATSSTVTKSLTVARKLPVSLAAVDYSVKKGRNAELYGWLRNGKKNQTVTLWQKIGKGKFTKLRTLTTKADGYFTSKVKITSKKDRKYKVKWRKSGKVKVSSVQTITVN